MPNGFMVPGGGAVSGDAFTARRLCVRSALGNSGDTANATTAGRLYVFAAHRNDASQARVSFSGGRCLYSETVYADRSYMTGAFLEVYAADSDGSVTVSGGNCILLELAPDA